LRLGCLDETTEQRARLDGPRFQFGVEVHADEWETGGAVRLS
jgi:hypothetical protein